MPDLPDRFGRAMELRGNGFKRLVLKRAHADDGTVLFRHLVHRATHARVLFALADLAAGGPRASPEPLLEIADHAGIIEPKLCGYLPFAPREVAFEVPLVVLQNTEDPGQEVLP